MFRNIFLTGFSGTGKSQVGRLVAQMLGWDFLDTDEEIVHLADRSIADIFAQEGEAAFRTLERQVVAQACALSQTVVSTGGGAIVDPGNRQAMERSGIIICLEARPETIHTRLRREDKDASSPGVRPLLAGPDPLEQIQALKSQRQYHYALAHWTVHTDALTPAEVAREVLRVWRGQGSSPQGSSPFEDSALAYVLQTPTAICPIFVDWGLLGQMGPRLLKLGITGPVYVIIDAAILNPHGRVVQRSLQETGIEAHCFLVSPGETSKSLHTAQAIYSWLAERRAERGHAILSLGGGMVSDLAGFVAATFLRGVPLFHAPTSLAAMVDASIGGKTAVNLPQGKNLVGAFYQPRAVLADLSTLNTLPRRDLLSGWAEAIKHGLILDASLFRLFEEKWEDLEKLEPGITSQVIRRSMAIKAKIVEEDERETTGKRTLLNYGHTIGHALEASTGYEQLLHGEAVSIGMTGAAAISRQMGLLSQDRLQRQAEVLKRFGLPTSCPGVESAQVLKATEVDKKTTGGAIKWVLLEDIGKATLRSDVPQEVVTRVVSELCH